MRCAAAIVCRNDHPLRTKSRVLHLGRSVGCLAGTAPFCRDCEPRSMRAVRTSCSQGCSAMASSRRSVPSDAESAGRNRGAGEPFRPPPDELCCRMAAQLLGVDPASSLVSEDLYNGVRSAAVAGMITVMVPWARRRYESACVYIAPHSNDVSGRNLMFL